MSACDINIDVDGARNTHMDLNIIVDDASGIAQVILDAAKQYVDPRTPTTRYRIDHINYVLHKELAVDLWWDADPPRLIRHLEGRGMVDRHLYDTTGGKASRVKLTASGWKEGEALKGSITIEAVKQ